MVVFHTHVLPVPGEAVGMGMVGASAMVVTVVSNAWSAFVTLSRFTGAAAVVAAGGCGAGTVTLTLGVAAVALFLVTSQRSKPPPSKIKRVLSFMPQFFRLPW